MNLLNNISCDWFGWFDFFKDNFLRLFKDNRFRIFLFISYYDGFCILTVIDEWNLLNLFLFWWRMNNSVFIIFNLNCLNIFFSDINLFSNCTDNLFNFRFNFSDSFVAVWYNCDFSLLACGSLKYNWFDFLFNDMSLNFFGLFSDQVSYNLSYFILVCEGWNNFISEFFNTDNIRSSLSVFRMFFYDLLSGRL